MRRVGLTVTQRADEVGLDARPGKKGHVHSSVIEPGHRAAIQPQGAGGDDEVGPLQAALTHCRDFGHTGLTEGRLHGRAAGRIQLWQARGEVEIVPDDDGQRRGQDFSPIRLHRQ